jgi:ubiquinone/menaquinone biosynthesis C-methylase UbiE
MRDIRAGLLSGATGRTLEIGAGTGHNLDHYPAAVTELVLAEPGEFMVARLRRKLADSGRQATVVEAPAEALPFPDDHFDTVVCTLVLCTVPEPGLSVAEVARVLKPGGRLLFVEHVRSEDPKIARRQDRLMRPWRFFGDGCHCNRDTLSTLEASPLEVDRVERRSFPKAPSFAEPLIVGEARRT